MGGKSSPFRATGVYAGGSGSTTMSSRIPRETAAENPSDNNTNSRTIDCGCPHDVIVRIPGSYPRRLPGARRLNLQFPRRERSESVLLYHMFKFDSFTLWRGRMGLTLALRLHLFPWKTVHGSFYAGVVWHLQAGQTKVPIPRLRGEGAYMVICDAVKRACERREVHTAQRQETEVWELGGHSWSDVFVRAVRLRGRRESDVDCMTVV